MVRGKTHKTTISEPGAPRPSDLVERDVATTRPNQLSVADITYVASWSAFVCVAFGIDAYTSSLCGWQVSRITGSLSPVTI